MKHPSENTITDTQDDFEAQLKPLWLRGHGGDADAHKQALTLIATRLRRFYGRRLQGLPHEVEDLVQETLLAVHVQRGTFDPDQPVSAWVFAIARHKLVDMWRRRGRRESLNDSFDELDEADHPVHEHEQSAGRDLNVLLNKLPTAQQQAIVMTRIEGLSMEEASQRTGVSVAALKVQVHRGLKRLTELVRSEP